MQRTRATLATMLTTRGLLMTVRVMMGLKRTMTDYDKTKASKAGEMAERGPV